MVTKAIKDFVHDKAHTEHRLSNVILQHNIVRNSLMTQKEAETRETSG
jgi:hypothetical protein